MPILTFSAKDKKLIPCTISNEQSEYKPIKIGHPLGIQILTFYPGRIKSEWGNKAEIMLSSQLRTGPQNTPAPELINMMVKKYDFRKAAAIRSWGGHVYGDPMIYYTKSYLGQRMGITLHGKEMDRIGQKSWDQLVNTMSQIGSIALFTPAAPYFAAAGLTTKIVNALVNLFNRNDRLLLEHEDLYFRGANNYILQSGRYLLWDDSIVTTDRVRKEFRLTGKGDSVPNLLVHSIGKKEFRDAPYLVFQIDGEERTEYDEFEIGAGSAELLAKYGDPTKRHLLHQIQNLAQSVNDAYQLKKVNALLGDYKNAATDEAKALIKENLDAHYKLFSNDNASFVRTLMDSQFS